MSSGVPTTMLSNISNAHSRMDPSAPHSPAISAPCAPRQPTQPKPQLAHWPRFLPPFAPGLGRDLRSPYAFVSPPAVSTSLATRALLAHRDFSTCERAQPRVPPCPRPRPIALPAQIPGVIAVTLNPVLRVDGGIDVDFSALDSSTTLKLGVGVLGEPATFPGLPALTLVAPGLPWVITAHASSGWVVVGDVLSAIGQALHMGMDEGDFEEGQEEMAEDRRKGGRGSGETTESRRMTKSRKQKTWGETRLRFLGGRTRFGGLVESTMGCDVWVVNFL
ncbi:hypothetical protein C8F04DRAFT_1402633 [Mycena alexandri]|uniref:DUF6699 domain-containing protein n=1 Tax=Mycena alexandri TaxID=1745969 RepID=A0AAD6S7D1_9AGAR|nr:hypothetical protein C8F04DRAFT_1402633 [Mycena alexandri]